MLDGHKGSLASVNSDSEIRVESITQGNRISYGVDLGFLETVALPAIRDSVKESPFDIIVIDEIGPMQLNSGMFRDLILDLLDRSNVMILGSVVARSFPWTDELKSRPDVETFLLTHQNRVTLTEMMTDYIVKRTRV
jgi:nucleoside-triphosphatase THEP1